MERKISALSVISLGFLLGLMGYFFFYEKTLGLSLPIYILSLIGITTFLACRNGTSLTLRRLWILVPIVFFATMTAIRASSIIIAINLLAIASLLALWVHFLTRAKHLDTSSFAKQILITIEVSIATVFGSISEFIGLAQWVKKHNFSTENNNTIAVLRGLAFAIPIVIVFGILLSSADLVFAQQLTSLFEIFQFDNIDTFIKSIMVIAIMTFIATGFLSYAVNISPTLIESDADLEELLQDGIKKPKHSSGFNLGLIETGIILTSVLLLFAFFVMIQFTYLFGASDVITDGVTFSDYARRGFFELVAVSGLTLGLMLILDKLTRRNSKIQHSIFRIQSVLLVLLTLVMLASAWQRMSLYELAYGFTHLRLFTHIFMICLGTLLVFGLLSVFRVRQQIFSFGVLLVIIAYAVTLNVINVDNYIASHNIERYQNGEELDMCYLHTLSADALSAMLTLENTDEVYITQVLSAWFYRLNRSEHQRHENYNPLLEWHWMNNRVWTELPDREIQFDRDLSTIWCY